MKMFWSLAAVLCGVVGALSLKSIGLDWHWPTSAREALVPAFILATFYAAWRCVLRARRAPNEMPSAFRSGSSGEELSVGRLAASVALAIVVMFVTFGIGFYVADSDEWGGDEGMLSQTLRWVGHGIPFAALKLHLDRLAPLAEVLHFALLTTIFYWLGSWWTSRASGQSDEGDAEPRSP